MQEFTFTIKNKNGSLRIYEATPITMFFGAGDDIVVLTLAQYFCELAFNFAVNGTNNTEFLRLILNSLHFLTVAKRYPPLIKAITELHCGEIGGCELDCAVVRVGVSCKRAVEEVLYGDRHSVT